MMRTKGQLAAMGRRKFSFSALLQVRAGHLHGRQASMDGTLILTVWSIENSFSIGALVFEQRWLHRQRARTQSCVLINQTAEKHKGTSLIELAALAGDILPFSRGDV